MASFDSFQFPPPVDWQDFERLCRDLYCAVWNDQHAQLNGRPGQRQHGVDVFGKNPLTGAFEGVQCKGRNGRYGRALTEQEVLEIVKDARSFQPSLGRFIIATSAQRDAKIQQFARDLSFRHQAEGLFEVVIESWQDILARLSYYEHIARVHFREFFLDTPDIVRPDMLPAQYDQPGVYTIDDIKLRRDYIVDGSIGNARLMLKVAGPITALSFLSFFFLGVSLLFGFRIAQYPNMFVLLGVMTIGFFISVRTHALLRCRFTDTLPPFRRIFFEANESGQIFVTRLNATCPYCGGGMHLQVVGNWRYATEEVFVCTRNPGQHWIILDHTVLPSP